MREAVTDCGVFERPTLALTALPHSANKAVRIGNVAN